VDEILFILFTKSTLLVILEVYFGKKNVGLLCSSLNWNTINLKIFVHEKGVL